MIQVHHNITDFVFLNIIINIWSLFLYRNAKYGEDPEFIRSLPYLLSWSFVHGLLLK